MNKHAKRIFLKVKIQQNNPSLKLSGYASTLDVSKIYKVLYQRRWEVRRRRENLVAVSPPFAGPVLYYARAQIVVKFRVRAAVRPFWRFWRLNLKNEIFCATNPKITLSLFFLEGKLLFNSVKKFIAKNCIFRLFCLWTIIQLF